LISPSEQIVKIQAYIENTSFLSDFKYFSVVFVDPCFTTSITSTQPQLELTSTVLAPTISYLSSSLLTDGVTEMYKSSSGFNCGSYTYSLI